MKRYKIIENKDKVQFEMDVDRAIKEGWRLIGGVSTTLNAFNYLMYSQAVYLEV